MSASTLATRLRFSSESIRPATLSQGLGTGMPETIAASFRPRRRFPAIRFEHLACLLSCARTHRARQRPSVPIRATPPLLSWQRAYPCQRYAVCTKAHDCSFGTNSRTVHSRTSACATLFSRFMRSFLKRRHHFYGLVLIVSILNLVDMIARLR